MTNGEIDEQVDGVTGEIAAAIRGGKDHMASAIAMAGVMGMLAEIAKRMKSLDSTPCG